MGLPNSAFGLLLWVCLSVLGIYGWGAVACGVVYSVPSGHDDSEEKLAEHEHPCTMSQLALRSVSVWTAGLASGVQRADTDLETVSSSCNVECFYLTIDLTISFTKYIRSSMPSTAP